MAKGDDGSLAECHASTRLVVHACGHASESKAVLDQTSHGVRKLIVHLGVLSVRILRRCLMLTPLCRHLPPSQRPKHPAGAREHPSQQLCRYERTVRFHPHLLSSRFACIACPQQSDDGMKHSTMCLFILLRPDSSMILAWGSLSSHTELVTCVARRV